MKIEYTHTRADFVTFNKVAKLDKSRKWNLVFIFVSVVAVLVLFNGPAEYWELLGPFQFAVQIGLIILALLVLKIVVKRRTNAKCDEEFSNSTLSDPVVIDYDEDGLTSEQTHQKTIWKWSAFQRVTVMDDNIFLWFGNLQAVMIPSRAIEGNEQRNELVAHLEEKIGSLSSS